MIGVGVESEDKSVESRSLRRHRLEIWYHLLT
jgi:hypothetical protein